jgi:hypothetical protein
MDVEEVAVVSQIQENVWWLEMEDYSDFEEWKELVVMRFLDLNSVLVVSRIACWYVQFMIIVN